MKIRLAHVSTPWDTIMSDVRLSYKSNKKSDSTSNTLGAADYKLLRSLVTAGNSHSKSIRNTLIVFHIQATSKWLQHISTYKVGVTVNSSSQMHTLLKSSLTQDNFATPLPESYLQYLNELRDNREFGTLVNSIPQGYLYNLSVSANYQSLRTIYHQRKSHKLDDWGVFCGALHQLPYSELITE